MRRLSLLLIAVFVAGPACAQDAAGMAILQQREMEAVGRQDLARQADIAAQNQLSTLQAQAQTEARLRELQAHNLQTGLPAPVIPPHPLPAGAAMAKAYPSIPDAELAASRARIVAASRNRR
jgi:hypothetical protein